jgi:hypothetical protein
MMMFIIEEPNDLGHQGGPGAGDEADDMVTRKIIDFESARKALEQEEPYRDGLEERSWLVRRFGVSWVELSLPVAIFFALLLCWFGGVLWLCRL